MSFLDSYEPVEDRLRVGCSVATCDRSALSKGLCQAHYDRKRRYPNIPLEYERPPVASCACGQSFSISPFGKEPTTCADCRRNSHRAASRARRHRSLMKEYGLTPRDYQRMMEAQDGVCAICGQPPSSGRGARNGRLSVDHDHRTGRVRGLLCHGCNAGLGNLRDDPALLRRALVYVGGA